MRFCLIQYECKAYEKGHGNQGKCLYTGDGFSFPINMNFIKSTLLSNKSA